MSNGLLTIWSDSQLVSAAIWLCLLIALLYLARRPCHELLRQASGGMQRLLRTTARILFRQADWTLKRNREVLAAMAEEHAERAIERELRRIGDAVARDLGSYPTLHRALSDQIDRIDEDYRQSADVPPMPPAWLDAIEAVASVDAKGDPALTKILDDMHATLRAACHTALLEYRATSQRRHQGLKRMQAYWRRTGAVLDKVQRAVSRINERAATVDALMQSYIEVRERREHALRMLQSSALVRFLASALMLGLAAIGIAVNFQLLYLPLGELLQAGEADFGRAGTAAVGLIGAQLLSGVAITELLGITRLFHFAGVTPEPARSWGLRFLLVLLVGFCVIEAGLVWSVQAKAQVAALAWLPGISHLLLGLVLPLALAPTGLVLEAFLQSARIVLGLLVTAVLRLLAMLARLLAIAIGWLSKTLISAYDLVVFLPLRAETALRARTAAPVAPDLQQPKAKVSDE